MSRIGKNPVIVPEGVNVAIEAGNISVKGKNGELSCHYDIDHVSVEMNENKVVVAPKSETKEARALWGTTRANINTLVKGVSEGFKKTVVCKAVGLKISKQGNKIVLDIGYSNPVDIVESDILTATPVYLGLQMA